MVCHACEPYAILGGVNEGTPNNSVEIEILEWLFLKMVLLLAN